MVVRPDHLGEVEGADRCKDDETAEHILVRPRVLPVVHPLSFK